MSDIEDEPLLKETKKVKKARTEKQLAAFEKARLKRLENITSKKMAIKEKEVADYKKKEPVQLPEKDLTHNNPIPTIPDVVEEEEIEVEIEEPIAKPKAKPKPKSKKRKPVTPPPSSDDDDSSSEEEEYIIRKRKTVKKRKGRVQSGNHHREDEEEPVYIPSQNIIFV